MNMQNENSSILPVREKVSYALGDFACCLIWQSISVYLLYYFTNVAGVPTADAVRIISISKILDGITDILMGFVIDRTKSRFGKVRPYILTMGLPLGLSTILLFSVPSGLSIGGKLIWIFVCYNLVTTVFYTALNVPYSSFHCFLTDDSDERARLSNIRLVFAYAAQVLINGSVFFLVRKLGGGELADQNGWTKAFLIIGIACFLLTLVTFFGTKERVSGESSGSGRPSVTILDSLRSVGQNKYLLMILATSLCSFMQSAIGMGAAAYFAQFILKNVDATGSITNAQSIAQVLTLIFVTPVLLRHFKKHTLYQASTILMIISFFGSALAPDKLPLILAMNALKGIAFAGTTTMIYGMCADAIDYGEWKTGINSAGLGTAMMQGLGKFGMGIGTYILGLILDFGGFEASAAVQTASGEAALIGCYTWIPGIFLVVTFLIMLAYHLDREYPAIIRELNKRRGREQFHLY